ncbi:hypothetical protein MKK75_03615 [Methylobacterium sp. J-030]|uniref:hypothetical protein n=1 Tax=Methylobacterium sp. J-030 TaxID=2836627 RepID=UPI001FB8F357|nr:hypothetical protein [Methylobacterium sp. J-030]MCJ2067906.1 hypothetical protein [Methylobacterium sp. J-030]
MLQRSPVYVGDLKPLGAARPIVVVRRADGLSSWATIAISCALTLAAFAAGAAWLNAQGGRPGPTASRRAAPLTPGEAVRPATFPSWVEVPHLGAQRSAEDDPDASRAPPGPRTFLDPNPAPTAGQPGRLPPRANPHLPLLSRAPYDTAGLTRAQPPVRAEPVERQDAAPPILPPAATPLEPEASPSPQDPAETRAQHVLPPDQTPVSTLPPGSAPVQAPVQAPAVVAVRPAPAISAEPPPRRIATLGPDPAQQGVDRTNPSALPRDAGAVEAPILNPGPARPARSLRRPKAVTASPAARVPARDTEQTASIITLPRPARGRIDAGAVAHAVLHRSRSDRSAVDAASPAPSSPWTLPPSLAPTD